MIKETLVILPGWGGSHETWQEFCALAEESIEHVDVIDLPCFGEEPCPSEVWGVEEYADFVTAKLQSYSMPVILMGHSFGGAVAAHIVGTKQVPVKKLILVGAAVYRSKRTLKRSFFKLLAVIGNSLFSLPLLRKGKGIAQKVLYRIADSPDYQHTSGIKREIYKKIVRQDQSSLLQNIHVPTEIIWGSEDTSTPLRDAKKLKQAITNSHLSIIDGGTHGLHHHTKSEFLSMVLNAIAS